MHKTIITLALIALAACTSVTPETEPAEQDLVLQEFTASFDSQTRTSLNGTHVLWDDSGESIDIINADGSIYTANQTGVSESLRSATFSGLAPEGGNIYAVYPSGACSEYDEGLLTMHLPSVQEAVADGFATHTSPTIAEIIPGETLYMRNICSMVGFKVTNSNIESVAFAAKEINDGAMTGTGYVEFVDIPSCYTDASTGIGHVELHGGLQPGVQYWALVYPGTYTNLKVVFTDANGRTATFTKDGTIDLERSKGHKISEFTISDSDWDDAGPAVSTDFTLVTDASSLQSGDELLIVYTGKSKALGPLSDNGNYREPVDISISNNTIASPGNATVLTLEAGSISGTWSFRDGENYLASQSSKNNYLVNSTSKNDYSSWLVSIGSNGLATIKAQAGERVYLSYNDSQPRFACYKDTNQKAVSIFRRGGSSSGSGSGSGEPIVSTLAATDVGMADATLNASFSSIPLNPDPVAAFFRWGTSASTLVNEAYDTNTLLNTASGSFSASLTGLAESTTYYYQAVITLHDGTDVEGEVKAFTTRSPQQSSGLGYLDCYEIPAVDVSGNMVSGNEKNGYKWYKYYTTNSERAVATHTFKYNNKVLRNYTVMIDASKKTPVWCATAFNSGAWPDLGVGRKGSWTSDPAFPESWQQENGTGSYGKGHLIASNYRQTTLEQNKQTFYLSNQAAQWQTRFNDGIWNNLEQRVKSQAPTDSDTLYVVVGVLFEGTSKIKDDIHIPSHFYKCIMRCFFNSYGVMTYAEGCAYLFENKEYTSGSYSSYKTTINAIEERAGLDFFHNVPDDLEEAAENAMGSPI